MVAANKEYQLRIGRAPEPNISTYIEFEYTMLMDVLFIFLAIQYYMHL